MSDMNPLIATRQRMFAENGRPPTVQKTRVGRYITPRHDKIAPAAKTAIIFAGSMYFIMNVAPQRQTMKREIAMV